MAQADEWLVRQAGDLGEAGASLWRSIAEHDPPYELRPDEWRTVLDACRVADRVEELEEQQRQVGSPIAKGSQGQEIVAPLIAEVRFQRGALNTLIKSLRLPDAKSGAPAGGGRQTPSDDARRAIRARWEKRLSG